MGARPERPRPGKGGRLHHIPSAVGAGFSAGDGAPVPQDVLEKCHRVKFSVLAEPVRRTRAPHAERTRQAAQNRSANLRGLCPNDPVRRWCLTGRPSCSRRGEGPRQSGRQGQSDGTAGARGAGHRGAVLRVRNADRHAYGIRRSFRDSQVRRAHK